MGNRSLLTGQEKCVTMEIKLKTSFYAVSFVWNILKKFLPANIVDNIRGMRAFKDLTGAVFDINEEDVERFEDVFTRL